MLLAYFDVLTHICVHSKKVSLCVRLEDRLMCLVCLVQKPSIFKNILNSNFFPKKKLYVRLCIFINKSSKTALVKSII
jgi:hypothetical protein